MFNKGLLGIFNQIQYFFPFKGNIFCLLINIVLDYDPEVYKDNPKIVSKENRLLMITEYIAVIGILNGGYLFVIDHPFWLIPIAIPFIVTSTSNIYIAFKRLDRQQQYFQRMGSIPKTQYSDLHQMFFLNGLIINWIVNTLSNYKLPDKKHLYYKKLKSEYDWEVERFKAFERILFISILLSLITNFIGLSWWIYILITGFGVTFTGSLRIMQERSKRKKQTK